MFPEWTTDVLRALSVLGLATGAYRGFKQLRANGPAPALANALSTVILLTFIVSATMLIIVYFAFFWPDYLIAFVVGTVVFLIGGFKLVSLLLYVVHRRFGILREGR